VTARNNLQISIILSLGRRNSRINSPTEMQYLVLKLIFKVFATTRASSTMFRNLCCNEFFNSHRDAYFVFTAELSERIYQEKWTHEYFRVSMNGKALCFICN
jgi:hypothetical protein